MNRKRIFDDIREERKRQNAKWGGPEHDKTHTISEWEGFIGEHAHKASQAASQGDPVTTRQRLVEVAALAVAAIEALDLITPPATKPQMRRQCPECGSVNVKTERRPNGDSECLTCGFKGKTSDFLLTEVT